MKILVKVREKHLLGWQRRLKVTKGHLLLLHTIITQMTREKSREPAPIKEIFTMKNRMEKKTKGMNKLTVWKRNHF